jgi:hypothetical protein
VPPSNRTWGRADYPLYSAMDATTKADAAQYLSSLVNETVRLPPSQSQRRKSIFSERSLYAVPPRHDDDQVEG